MIKDILVNLTAGAARDVAAQYAISVAGTFDAHVTGVAFAYEAALPPTIIGSMPADFIEAQRAQSEHAAKLSIAAFDAQAQRAGLSAESQMHYINLAGASDLFGRLARHFDLAVVAQGDPQKGASEQLIAEAALFESGRPVFVIPYIQKEPLKLDRVLVCWDAGRSAARALGDAIPILSRAKDILIVIVSDGSANSRELQGVDIAQHLARHNLNVELRRIVAGGIDVGNAILSYAADCSADIIVMGGYGHSRLREFILGGTTRSILTAMTIPTLMSH